MTVKRRHGAPRRGPDAHARATATGKQSAASASGLARAVMCLVLIGLASCSLGRDRFSTDTRVTFVTPGNAAAVTLPTTIRWRTHGLALTHPPADLKETSASSQDGVYFAVFVDRTPMAPGAPLLSLADPTCKATHYSCITPDYFAQSSVYLTDATSLQLPAVPTTARHHAELVPHSLTIVLMRGTRRDGEAAYTREFFVKGGSR
jgi:hypothetical protein